jgi:hypothetical protein
LSNTFEAIIISKQKAGAMAVVAVVSRQVMQNVVHDLQSRAMMFPRPFFNIVLEFASNGKKICRIGFCPALLYETFRARYGLSGGDVAHWICCDLVLRQASRGCCVLAQ